MYLICILAALSLWLELRWCLLNKVSTSLLFFYVFNLIFLSFWPFLSFFDSSLYIDVDVLEILLFWNVSLFFGFFVSLFFKKKVSILMSLKVDNKQSLALWLCFSICVAVTLYYFYINGISLLADDVDEARHGARKGGGHINMFLTRGLLLFGTCLIAVQYLKGKMGAALFLIMFICLIQAMTGFRANLIVFLFSLGSVYTYLNRRAFTLNSLAFISAVVLILFVGITYFKYQNAFYDDFWGSMYGYVEHRVFLELPRVIGYCLTMQHEWGYLLGATYWRDIATILPGPDLGFGDILMLYQNPYSSIGGVAPLTPSIVGESLVNWGVAGIVFLGVLLPCLLSFLDSLRNNCTLVGLVFIIYIGFFLANSIMLGVGTLFVSRFFPLLIFWILFKIMLIGLKQMRGHS